MAARTRLKSRTSLGNIEGRDVGRVSLESERRIYRVQAEQEGKPAKILDKIVEGKVSKFLKEVVLVEQGFVKDPDRTVADLLRDVGKQVGAGVTVTGFRRFRLGEVAAE